LIDRRLQGVDGFDHAAERGVELAGRDVEVVLEDLIGLRRVASDAEPEFASGESLESFADEACNDLAFTIDRALRLVGLFLLIRGLRLLGLLGDAGHGLRRLRGVLGARARGVGGVEHVLEAADDPDQRDRLDDQDDRMQQNAVDTRRLTEDRGRQEKIGGEMMHGDRCRSGEDHRPVGEHDEQRQRGEIGHMHVTLPFAATGNQQRHLRHQRHAGDAMGDARQAKAESGDARGERHADGARERRPRNGRSRPALERDDRRREPQDQRDEWRGDAALFVETVEDQFHQARSLSCCLVILRL